MELLTFQQPTVTHTPRIPDAHAVNAGDVSWNFVVPEPTVTHTPRVPDAHAVNVGDVAWTFDVPEPTVTHTAFVPTLALSELDTTGLVVDFAALLESTADGSPSPADLYVNSDRGGTGVPLDGELGLGPGESIISRVRRPSATQLIFNDDDDPAVFDLGDYFSNGDGNGLTIYFVTSAGGQASFPVAGNIDSSRENFIRFDIPSDVQTLLDGIFDGDRFIVAGTRAVANHAVRRWRRGVGLLTSLNRPSLICSAYQMLTR